MGEYEPLCRYLLKQSNDKVSLAFRDMENILAFHLPEPAYITGRWWEGRVCLSDSHTKAWLDSGWEIYDLSLERQMVTFTRVGAALGQSKPGSASVTKLEQCGHRFGFIVRKDWKTRYGTVDLVWLKGFYRPLPGLAECSDLPVVAFEVESSWQTTGLLEADSETTDWKPTKDVMDDLVDLLDSKAPLSVLVLCKGPNDTKQAIDRTKKAAVQFMRRQWDEFYLALVWDEEDVEKLCADLVH